MLRTMDPVPGEWYVTKHVGEDDKCIVQIVQDLVEDLWLAQQWEKNEVPGKLPRLQSPTEVSIVSQQPLRLIRVFSVSQPLHAPVHCLLMDGKPLSDLRIDPMGHSWRLPGGRRILLSQYTSKLGRQIIAKDPELPDVAARKLNRLIQTQPPLGPREMRQLWDQLKVLPSQKFAALSWLLSHTAIPCAIWLFEKGMDICTKCLRCGVHEEETLEHLFWSCPASRRLWIWWGNHWARFVGDLLTWEEKWALHGKLPPSWFKHIGKGRERRDVACTISFSTAFPPRRGRVRLQANSSRSGEVGGCYLLPSPEQLICCWARGDRSKVRRKAKTKRISRRVSQSLSMMAAMVVLLLLGLLQLAVPGLAQSPPSGSVQIQSVTYAGFGCLPGSAEVLFSDDGTAFTVKFGNFTAFSPGRPADRKRNCRVGVNMIYPAGFVYTLETVTFTGYAEFEEGVKGSVETGYFFSDIPGTVTTLREVGPPLDGNFEFTEGFLTFVYPPCGSESVTLNINSVATVVSPAPPMNNKVGLITIDQQDFRLRWTQC
ncbi:hypothetical protein CBR_g25785 [Chara braunii]|uniref:Reverse transcriptase zinc-binding domain-containing protein n=1 Tax=Chara braunii TaxID=69332 RepID=A0A388L6E1_CHABU|nr:hypothetical protein CBR_g25785 [Chara braunii]|eukprot:GBG77854.1 hypothetical protein CBR_g25785 [Chara braunii]